MIGKWHVQLEPVSNKWIFGGIFELARVEQNVEVHFLSKKDIKVNSENEKDFEKGN